MIKDWKTILPEAKSLVDQAKPFAIATVVGIQGSAYRGLGSRLLIDAKGETTGLISGGCLEPDIAQHALGVIESGVSKQVTYDSQTSQDLIWGLGLGCGGVIRVLIEKACKPERWSCLAALQQAIDEHQIGILATVFDDANPNEIEDLGDLLWVGDDVHHLAIDDPALAAMIKKEVAHTHRNLTQAFDLPPCRVQTMNTRSPSTKLILQPLAPPPTLLVCGGGIDAEPIAQLANFLGWETKLALPRPSRIAHHRWAGPPETVVTVPEKLDEAITIDRRSCVLVMSHNYENDLNFLAKALASPARYVGILGPKRRTLRLMADLRARGFNVDATRLFYPMGLDIGAETPEEVALAILAEVRAFIANRQGGHLKLRKGSIHNR